MAVGMEIERVMQGLENKIILVTGAAGGIGRATAERLLAAGARVIVHYNSGRDTAEKMGARHGAEHVHTVRADLQTPEGVDILWQSALDWQGQIDAIVNNAGVLEGSTPDVDTETWRKSWRRVMAVNLDAVGDLSRYAVLHFKERGCGGMIVNIASRAAFRGDLEDSIHYAASKGGVVALTRSLAKCYAKDGILAYVVAPGWVATERVLPKINAPENAAMISEIPMGEPAPPEEVANIVAFLLSGQARHATGATIDINGASYFH